MSDDIICAGSDLDNSIIVDVANKLPEHFPMVDNIKNNLPEIQRASSFFHKTQSQFMDNMLTVSHHTPLRNARQILAEIEKSKSALKEAHFRLKKKEVELKMKMRDLEVEKDILKREMLLVEASEIDSQIEDSGKYISGAIRKISNYIDQYNSILKTNKLENFNEEDFEKDEEAYHIMRAFDQGLCAARTRGGVIDEGNMIYLTQIGINGASAQQDIYNYLKKEGQLLVQGVSPTYAILISFLKEMASKYAGCSLEYAKSKGMLGTYTEKSLLKKGDTRLLENS